MTLTRDRFLQLMAPLGPFEAGPEIAVAVSGGADSMALALLAADWAQAEGGRIRAFTVDHALRPDSAAEARTVQAWLDARGIPHEILVWTGPKPERGIQAAAREARYRLLTEACRRQGILHLLLAHHAGDQAETVAIRAARGSGTTGLSGMRPVAPPPLPGPRWPRLLRPLLSLEKAELSDYLLAHGQDWIEDPSNRNRAFTRVLVRETLDDPARAALCRKAATARAAADRETAALARLLARDATIHAAGFAVLPPAPFAGAPAAERRAAWARLLATVGGHSYPPRGDQLDGLMTRLDRPDFRGATLAGCRIEPGRARFRVMRELDAVRDARPFKNGMMWDGRFLMEGSGDDSLKLRRSDASGADIWGLPAAVRRSLPTVWQEGHCLGFVALAGVDIPADLLYPAIRARFLPPNALLY